MKNDLFQEIRDYGENNIKTNFIRKDGSVFGAEITITPNFANGKDKPQTGYCGITKELDQTVNIPIKFTTKLQMDSHLPR